MKMTPVLALAALAVLASTPADAHSEGIAIRSTSPGGGALVANHVEPLVTAALVFCANGECLWESEEGSILTPADDETIDPHHARHAETFYALTAGTTLSVEIVSIDEGASLKIGDAKLDGVGEAVQIGQAPTVHSHILWQIEAAEDAIGEWSIVFRLSASTGGYAASENYEVLVTNADGAGTTTTTSSTSSTTIGDGTVCGNGIVEGDETCDHGDDGWHAGHSCNEACVQVGCGDPDDDGAVSATDALFILGVAVGTQHCDACVCNVDGSTASAVTGVDALHALHAAIAVESSPFQCPVCGD